MSMSFCNPTVLVNTPVPVEHRGADIHTSRRDTESHITRSQHRFTFKLYLRSAGSNQTPHNQYQGRDVLRKGRWPVLPGVKEQSNGESSQRSSGFQNNSVVKGRGWLLSPSAYQILLHVALETSLHSAEQLIRTLPFGNWAEIRSGSKGEKLERLTSH